MTDADNLKAWERWLADHWLELVNGAQLDVSAGALPHPLRSGFARIMLAEPAGQSADYGLSLGDGSRIHVHAFEDNSLRVHRDRHDPARGLVPAIRHYFGEAPSARVVLAAGAGWLGYRALRRVLLPVVVLLVLVLELGACLPSDAPPPAVPADICWDDYAALVVGMALDLTQACKPLPVEQCGTMRERVIERWQPKFDQWEARCEGGKP